MDGQLSAPPTRVRKPHGLREESDADFATVAQPASLARPLTEEFANTLTHGAGTLLSMTGAAGLLYAATERCESWLVSGCTVYAAALVSVYAASTASHAVREPRRRRFFRALDQAAIYLLIAGTYTPFALAHVCHGAWPLLLAVMWAIALLGFCSKLLWGRGVEAVSVPGYVLLGWLPALAIGPMLQSVPWPAVAWVFAGGVCYTLGTVFLALDQRYRYFHALWHLLVLAGSACHYIVILRYVALGEE